MKIRLKPISEQVVVLLGATSGIGLETAKYLIGKGAQVVIVGRNQEGLNDALEQANLHRQMVRSATEGHGNGHSMTENMGGGFSSAEAGGAPVTSQEEQVIGLEADVTNFEQVRSVADQVVSRFGRIDTWVNLAAVSEWALFEDTSPDEFRRIIEVNLMGQANGAMAALPYLKQQNGGALIFVASIDGKIPMPYQSAYNASKHGILGMVDTLRMEMKHTRVPVSVTSILPASIDTPLFEKARTKIGVEPNPMPPVYEPKMVARAIAYASEHPVRELIVGDAGYMMTFMRRLAPTLTDNFLGASGFRMQQSRIPKSAQAPDNLYHHVSGYNEVYGDNPPQKGRISVLTWLSTHPAVRLPLYALLIAGTGGLIGWRIVRARSARRSWRYQLPRQAKKAYKNAYKQVSKATGKALKSAGKTKLSMPAVANIPVVSNMPMFRKRSRLDQIGEVLAGAWAAVVALKLPFIRRESRMSTARKTVSRAVSQAGNMVSDNIPSIRMPWNRQPSMVDRLTLAEQRKTAMKAIAKTGGKAIDRISGSGKDAAKAAGKAADRVSDRSKDAAKSAGKVMDQASSTGKDALKSASRNMAKSDKNGKTVVVRRDYSREKLPRGERIEYVVETERRKK